MCGGKCGFLILNLVVYVLTSRLKLVNAEKGRFILPLKVIYFIV